MNPITGEVGTLEEIEEQLHPSDVEFERKHENVRPILLYGDPFLKTPTVPFEKVIPEGYESLDHLLQVLFATMYAARGAGLAAPQIGVGLSIFVVDVAQEHPGQTPNPLVFINPSLEFSETKKTFVEGCLSVPGRTGDVIRSAEVEITYLDAALVQQTMYADGILADALQHEYDHLLGISFVDRMQSVLKRDIIRRAMRKMHKRIEFSTNGKRKAA